jgi:hypothetical protein
MNPGVIHVHEFREFIDILISVTIEVDIGWDIQGEHNRFLLRLKLTLYICLFRNYYLGSKIYLIFIEIIITIYEYPGIFIRDQLFEICLCEVREGEMLGSLDMFSLKPEI